jgi:hypothetical protein
MRKLALPLLLLLAGCGAKDDAVGRAAGVWPDGKFAVESYDGKTDAKSLQTYETKGMIALYATGMKFLIEMRTPQQGYTIKGKWKAEKNRVTLTANDFVFDNPTEEDQKAYHLDIIAPDALRAAFAHDVVLDESVDKRSLTGLKMSIGKLIGRFEFVRPIPR